MIINSKDYFNKKINWNKNYEIFVVKTNNDIKNMILHFNKFIKLGNKKKFISLDFEFNSSPEGKKIALFQINLETENEDGTIFLFYPPDLNTEQTNILKQLLTQENTKKILHGAEALDIPYLFKNIFVTDDLRKKFCNNLFDTRYLCEYYHLENSINDKCKIYQILRQMDVIDDKQLEMLLKNEEDMGPIYLIEIDVRNLNDNTMLYSAFDVLYLAALIKQFPDNKIYTKLIPQITCFNFIDKYENIFTKPFSELVGKANNFFIKINNPTKVNLKLIDIYQMYYYWVDDEENILTKLMEINYFKKFIETFIKFVIYKTIFNNYKVWEKNDKISDIINDFNKEEKKFQKIKLSPDFETFFSKIRNILKKDIVY